MCVILDTAKKLGCLPRQIFVRAAEQQGFINALDIAAYRFDRWLKKGEIQKFVENYCLDQFRKEVDLVQPNPRSAALSPAVS